MREAKWLMLTIAVSCTGRAPQEVDAGGGPPSPIDDGDEVAPPPCPVEQLDRELPSPTLCAESTTIVGGYEARSQAEVDMLVGCEEVTEHLFVVGQDVVSLAALASLRRVGTSFFVESDPPGLPPIPLCSLAGLEGLREVGGFTVAETFIENLAPLRDLELVGDLGISNNARLTSLFPDGARAEAQYLYVASNPFLETLDSIAGVTVAAGLVVSSNERLVSISGLSSAQGPLRIYITIDGNPRLPSLDGLAGFTAPFVDIRGNAALTDMAALFSFDADNLSVTDNASLTSVAFDASTQLNALTIDGNAALSTLAIGAGKPVYVLRIVNNVALDNDAMLALAESLLIEGHRKVDGNLGSIEMKDPCPWTSDGDCDAPPQERFCAEGTDDFDCYPVKD